MAKKKKKSAAKKKTHTTKAAKTKKTARKATKVKAKKRPAKKATKRPTAKKAAKKAVAKKPAKKAKPARRSQDVQGEGNYSASRRFRKAETDFIKRNKSQIPEMGKAAEAALEGPEGNELRAAEDAARAHAHGQESEG